MSPATVNFTVSVLTEVAKLFPSSAFSTGGDELNVPCYDQDAETQQILTSTGQTLNDALNTFVRAAQGSLHNLGKTPIVWEGTDTDNNNCHLPCHTECPRCRFDSRP